MPARRRFAWPVFLIVSALVVTGVISVLLRGRSDESGATALALRDGHGEPFQLSSLDGQAWVAGFAAACEAAPTDTRLSSVAGRLPGELPLICFSLGVPPNLAVSEPARWKLLHGDAAELRELALDYFGFTPGDVDACDGGTTDLFATVSRKGRTVELHRFVSGDTEGAVAGLVADADWLQAIDRRPTFHALMNGLSALMIVCGLLCIRRKWIVPHVTFMLLATSSSALFLVSYLYYHHHAGSTGFQGQGAVRWLYFSMLLTHTVLAAFLAPLVLTLLTHALRRRFDRHRSLGRWTYPIWLYVSVTGVLIYLMLYVWFAP